MTRAVGLGRPPVWLAALALLAAPLHAASLADQIARLLDASTATRTAFWGIQIVDLENDRTLYELNPDHGFVPASNAKLFTTALALATLGPGFTFQTRVLATSGPDADGRIAGSLTLVGGGDPNLSGREIPYRMGSQGGNPLAAIEDLAGQLVARGVKRVDGDIVGDDSWYVWQPYAEGWAVDDAQFDFGAAVSALSIDDNTVSLTVKPAARVGGPAELVLDPPVEYFRMGNRIRTVAAGGPREIRFERDPGSREVRLWGSIPVRDRGETLLLGIDDPAEFAALAFRQALQARGVVVAGEALARHVFPNEAGDLKQGAAPPGSEGVELARRISPPLIEDLRVTDKVSQNLHAELALRAVARARRQIGSREAGLEEMQAFLTGIGIEPECCNFADASGLSRLDLLTPAAVVKLLKYMYASPMRNNWLSLLPVAGRDGTLSARMGEGPADGRIYAKTGTMSHVSALSGYAHRQGGGWLAFSILVNNYNARAAEVRGAMDRICTLIVEGPVTPGP